MIRHFAAAMAAVALAGALASANGIATDAGSLAPARDKIASTDTAQSDGTKVTPQTPVWS